MKKSHFYIITPVVIVTALVASWFYFLSRPVIEQSPGYVYYLKPGTSKQHLIDDLAQQGIIRHSFLFSLYVYPYVSSHLKTGEYFFPKGATPLSIWKQVSTGTGLYYRSFAIIPGWTFNQLRTELGKAEGLRHFTEKMDDKQIMAHFADANMQPEGQFFPETYYYTRNNLDLVILKRAYDLMQKRLNEAWQQRAADLPYKTAYEALIVASLVEKEAYLNPERPMIAGVIVNRLRKNMLLQIDPTVIYGMGARYVGKIHKEDLRENTPYNTYMNKGLPPTPIAMPSFSSIEAAMHPQVSDYYYFVARGDGSHQFSKTLTEHNTAVDVSIKRKVGAFNDVKIRQYLADIFKQTGQINLASLT